MLQIKKIIQNINDLTSFPISIQFKILKSSRLKKYYTYLLVDNKVKKNRVNNIKQQRKIIGLNSMSKILNHLEFRDAKTKGCGCKLCLLRHKEYLSRLEFSKLQKELNYLGTINNNILGTDTEGSTKHSQRINPFNLKYILNYKGGILVKVKLSKKKIKKTISGKKFGSTIKILKREEDIPQLIINVEKQKKIVEQRLIKVFGDINKYFEVRTKLGNLLWLPI